MTKIRATIWNEFVQDSSDPAIIAVYPDGIHGAIAEGLQQSARMDQLRSWRWTSPRPLRRPGPP